ncbi:MAG: PilN domain-containing protein, partial [Bacteroidetes bacterium]|nr:PilN domain-containing protein [Bacteroidota bacterium]
ISMIFLAQKFYYNHKDIARSEKILITKNKEAEELKFFEQRILDLQSRMAQREQLQVIIDTFKVGSGRWINLLHQIDDYDLKKSNMWVTSILLSDQGINLTGVSLGRKSIPDFSQNLSNSNIKNILNQRIREKKINVFEIIADPEKFGYQVSLK